MPDIVLHNKIGEDVFRKMEPVQRTVIDYDIFRFALQGPDAFLFYRFFSPYRNKDVVERSKTMHELKTGVFLTELAKEAYNDKVFSFLAGFLCHYALDSVAHPYIIKKANGIKYMHMAIEHRLDMLELGRLGKTRGSISEVLPAYPVVPEVGRVVEKVYGWNDCLWQTSYRHMRLWYKVIKDKYNVLYLVFHIMRSEKAAIPYSSRICEHMDLSEFDSLYLKAVEEAVMFISAVYDFTKDRISEKKLKRIIGNRSYSGS